LKILVINAATGPDYLADLVFGELINSEKYNLYTNHLPTYMFDDYINPSSLYGKGYTVFSKIESLRKKTVDVLSNHRIIQLINEKFFDRIIFTSIWRCNDFIDLVISNYPKECIKVFDGEDHNNILSISNNTSYYKRELLPVYSSVCFPVSFSYPSYYQPLVKNNLSKQFFLAPCIPGLVDTYRFNTESSYYLQYSSSWFSLTTKKAGWDCMRHYEIIKAGSIPYFPGIVEKPITTMSNYPVDLQIKANYLFETMLKNPSLINTSEYLLRDISDNFSLWIKKCGHTNFYQKLFD